MTQTHEAGRVDSHVDPKRALSDVAVIVPVLGRPDRAMPLAESLRASQRASVLELVFVCSPDDGDQILTCAAATEWLRREEIADDPDGSWPDHRIEYASWPRIRGDYARKINLGLHTTQAPYVFCGADDLVFHPGWADAAISVALEQEKCFIATNDLGNPLVQKGEHATHPLVCREYALECGTIDTPGLIYHEGYWHQYIDNEATGTAKYRDCFAFAPDAVVEHMHPIWRKAEQDETYRLGDENRVEDRKLWTSRRPMWGER